MLIEEQDPFALLIRPLQRAIEERGFTFASEPQRRAIPYVLKGENVLLIAPTATGKTEAAILPILNNFMLVPERQPGIKILYITPLRALNRDILDRLEWWGKRLDVKVSIRHGDTDVSERSRQSKSPPDMLITTPETLQAILPGRNMRKHLSVVRWVIVDEVHELAGDKRGGQLALALERLRYLTMKDFQMVGLSATIGSPDKVASFLVGSNRPCRVVKVPLGRDVQIEVIYAKPRRTDYGLSAKLYTHPEVATRLRIIRNLIEKHNSVLLFTNTRSVAEVLASRFKVWDDNFPVSIHHGSLAKSSRIMAERGLKGGELKGLVCTSSLELGIDVGRIDLVIQYNSPRQVTRLIQRVGRSGHSIGKIPKGVVITLDSDDTMEALAIARKVKNDELEPVNVPEKPLDALTHQIVGLMTLRSRWHYLEVLDIFKKAYPYRDLEPEDIARVAIYMHTRTPRLAWTSLKDQVILKPMNTKSLYRYYFNNLSMIPDENQYLVIDEKNDQPVGVLDEAFVAEHGDPGTKFIVRGSPWKIRHVYEKKIYVNAVKDPTGAIPSWVGEEIPVPYEIAMEVGEIRGTVERLLDSGKTPHEAAADLAEIYPAKTDVLLEAIRETVEQWSQGYPIPTNKRITVEEWKDYVIIQCSFGSLVNKTLARVLGHVLSEKLGEVVGVQEDPYRVIIQTHGRSDSSDIIRVIFDLAKEDLIPIARDAIVKTGLFKRRIVHVARKFGAISKWADFNSLNLRKLIDSFKETAIFDEAMKDTFVTDMDIPHTREVLDKIRDGTIDIQVVKAGRTPTPIASVGIERISHKTDLIPPEKMRSILVESARARLTNEAGTFLCVECWQYVQTQRIKELPKKLLCPKCGSKRIGMVKDSEDAALKIAEKKDKVLRGREQRTYEFALGAADLIRKYGQIAAMALSGHNLLPEDVSDVLSKQKKPTEKFFELILEAEKGALRRRFL